MTLDTPAPRFWLLVLIALTGTIGIHIFVPALQGAAQGLNTSSGDMQLTISIYIVGLAFGQLLYGPASDALGRVPVLRAGLALYVAASLACALAPTLPLLLAGRFVQAVAAGAGLVLGRAIVRDTTAGEKAVSQLAMLNVLLVLSPAIAPVVGGAIAVHGGWRAIFIVLSVMGLATLLLTWKLLPETRLSTQPVRMRQLFIDYLQLVRSPRFFGLAICMGCSTSSIYAFLAAAPFIFTQNLHQPVHLIGAYSGLIVFGTAIGNAATARFARFVPARRMLLTGNAINLVCIFAMLALVLLERITLTNTVALMTAYTVGSGVLGPVAMGKAMDVDARLVGSAAGLFGFIQLTIGAICTALAAFGSNPALCATVVISVATVLASAGLAMALSKPAAS